MKTWDDIKKKFLTKEEIEEDDRFAEIYENVCKQKKGRRRQLDKIINNLGKYKYTK